MYRLIERMPKSHSLLKQTGILIIAIIVHLCILPSFQLIFLIENVALNKSAWQNNPYSVRPWGAEHAVDGEKLNLSAEGGQCAISYGGQTAEWRVNLGRVYTIHHILIQFRTDNLVWGKFYFIFLTENTEIKKEINGQFKNKHYSKKKKIDDKRALQQNLCFVMVFHTFLRD